MKSWQLFLLCFSLSFTSDLMLSWGTPWYFFIVPALAVITFAAPGVWGWIQAIRLAVRIRRTRQ